MPGAVHRRHQGVSRKLVIFRAIVASFTIACCAAATIASAAPGGTALKPFSAESAAQPSSMETESPSPSPTVTPLPPPPVPPPDAAGISGTTPPLGAVSPAPSPTVPDMLWLAAHDTSSIPLTMHGGRPFIPVVVDGVRREFLLSDLQPSAMDESEPVDGSTEKPLLRTLQIGDVRLTNVPVMRRRLRPFSQTYLGAPADGVIGSDLFARFPVLLDYADHLVTIYRTEQSAVAARPPGAPVVPLQAVNGLPSVSCTVDGKSVAPCFVDVFSDDDIALWNPGSKDVMNRHAMRMRDAEVDHEMSGTVMRAHTLALGGGTVVGGALLELMDGSEDEPRPGVRALLGSGVLSRFAVTIDEPAGSLTLASTPAALTAPSPFDASGVWLVWRNGDAVVRSVVPGSPGDKAGLRGGDVVVAVNGSALLDLDAARQAFMGPTGTVVRVTLQRSSVRKDVALVLRSLL